MKKIKKDFNLAAVKRLIATVPKENQKSVVCSLIGHSRIVTQCMGYVYCGRCEAQIADKLGGYGYSQAEECVQVGHNCKVCRKNYKAMDWKDKFLAQRPFTKVKR